MARGFADRAEAGRALAARLAGLAGDDPIVLGLPRGGVPVAWEVARALRAPLDVLVARKLGVPGREELALGAIATGGARVVNEDVMTALGLDADALERVAAAETRELERRERRYRGDRGPLRLEGRTAILVDDGLATGATMRAAVRAARAMGAARVVVAVPVGARQTLEVLRAEADEVVCPLAPEPFVAVGAWYEDFRPTGDDEVRALLSGAPET